jgi:hypothetical protein
MIIGTVVEGPSDRLVLRAVLDKLIPGPHRYLSLQPTPTLGETGSGWKGVRRWCRETWQWQGASLAALLSGATGPTLDLLVIHVDASIATEADLQEGDGDPVAEVGQPCPPAAPTAARLRQVILRWLRQADFPSKIILAVPAQDTESWTFAALFPDDELCGRSDYECLRSGADHPGYRLTLKKYGKSLRRSDGQIKKSANAYQTIAPRVAAAWTVVQERCAQAEQLTQDVIQSMQ